MTVGRCWVTQASQETSSTSRHQVSGAEDAAVSDASLSIGREAPGSDALPGQMEDHVRRGLPQ